MCLPVVSQCQCEADRAQRRPTVLERLPTPDPIAPGARCPLPVALLAAALPSVGSVGTFALVWWLCSPDTAIAVGGALCVLILALIVSLSGRE